MASKSDSPQPVERTPAKPSTPSEGTRQAGCIVRRLRQTRANMIGTDDEQHYWDCHDAAGEIERLRLTDAERFVLREVMDIYAGEDDVASNEIAAVIDGLLERTK